jgi:hypothetical protein
MADYEVKASEEERDAFHEAYKVGAYGAHTTEQYSRLVASCLPAFLFGYRAAKLKAARDAKPDTEQVKVRAALAKQLNYPDEWDTAAYPNVESAAVEALATKEAERNAFYTMDQMRDFAAGMFTTRAYVVQNTMHERRRELEAEATKLHDAGNPGAAGVYTLVAAAMETLATQMAGMGAKPFQKRAEYWAKICFGLELATSKRERVHRFGEEAIETMQAFGMTRKEAHAAVNYVYSRPVGDKRQEIGGTMTTLAVLCAAHGIDMIGEGERDLMEISDPEVTRKIREKRTKKPDFGANDIEPIARRQFLDSLHCLPTEVFQILTNSGASLTPHGEAVFGMVKHLLLS